MHIRWMIRRDIDEVLEIERLSFSNPWTEEEFMLAQRRRKCIAMVIEDREKVVGFMLYELHNTRLQILNFAVHPEWRRNRVGTQMVQKLVGKLSSHRRTRITVDVRESNLDAQSFFKRQGFRAYSVIRGFFDDTGEDAYAMEFVHQEAIADNAVVAKKG